MQKNESKGKKISKFVNNQFDFIICITIFLLLALGIVMVLSASAPASIAEGKGSYSYVSKQLIFACIGIVLMFFISKIDYRFYKKYYWINYVPFIATYFEAFLESKTKDVKEVFKNIPEKTEENMKKFLEIEDLRKFQMYCIVQSFLFKEKIDRSDTKKKEMKIIDLKYTKNAEKMVKNYVSRQYSIEYALKTQKITCFLVEAMIDHITHEMPQFA